MSQIRFLFDEHVAGVVVRALRNAHPGIDILCVGDPGVSPFGTPDPDLLEFAETAERLMVTKDKRTFPGHLAAHFAKGRHTWGVAIIRPNVSTARTSASRSLLWQADSASAWRDRTDYIPY